MIHRFLVTLVVLTATAYSAGALPVVGRTPGIFNVSSMGSAQYSIPIFAPPGPNGLQPHVSLVYNSLVGNGPVGVGWSIAGLGAITRCNRTVAQDPAAAPIALVVGDGYCLNGSRLRLTGGTYGGANSTYQTEIANFMNVTAYGGSATNGPSYFIAQDRNAVSYYFGNSTDSQVRAPGTSTALSWQLNQVVDPAGNTMRISYGTATGAAVPTSIAWVPIAHGSTNYLYSMVLAYGTRVPNNTTNKYVAGSFVFDQNLLGSITINKGLTAIRQYTLSYQASPTTGRDQLHTIQETAPNTGDSLPATTFSYQSGGVGITTSALTAPSAELRYDFNGDGLPDAVYSNGSTFSVALNTGSGFGTPINTGISNTATVIYGDVLGSGTDGILASNSTTNTFWYYQYQASSNTFPGVDTHASYTAGLHYSLTDITGDGLPDLVTLNAGLGVTTLANTSVAGVPSFATTPFSYNITLPNTIEGTFWHSALYSNSSVSGSARRSMDFNADGRQDALLWVSSQKSIGGGEFKDYYYYYELLSNGANAQFTIILLPFSDQTINPNFVVGNFNDDTCADVALGQTVYYSACNGTVATTFTLPGTASIFAGMDWDGDGRTDILSGVPGGALSWYQSTGSGFTALQSTGITIPNTCSFNFFVADVDADGLDDIGCINSSSTATYWLHNQPGMPADLLSQMKDGNGNTASPTYVPLSQHNYTKYADAGPGYANYIGPRYVVSQATYSDPSNMPGGTYNQTFWYYAAWMNLQGRGFDAFGAMQTTDSRNGLSHFQYFERGFPYTGMPSQDYLVNGTFYPTQTINTLAPLVTLSSTSYQQRYFAYFNNSTTTRREVELHGPEDGKLITTSSTDITRDNFGNATTVKTTVTDNDLLGPAPPNSAWVTTTVNTFVPNAGTNCLGLLSGTTVTNQYTVPLGAAITRTIQYNSPNLSACRETEKVTEPTSQTYKVVEDFGYDTFGNLHTDTVTGLNLSPRATTVSFDTAGQFPTSIQNPLLQSVAVGYDPYTGKLNSQSDLNSTMSNPIVTSWQYDGFGRKLSESRPDGTSTTWVYKPCATNGCVNNNNVITVTQTIKNMDATTQSVQNGYFDAADRPLVTSRTMLNGAFDRSEVQYDPLGRVIKSGAPCTFVGCVNYWTSTGYDVLNRPLEVERPINATSGPSYCDPTIVPPAVGCQGVSYGYQGRTMTVTDPLGNMTTHIKEVAGNLWRSQDPKGYFQNFLYDPFGSLTSVIDSVSNTLFTANYAYGIKAFQVSSVDVDLGARSYTVDALGELTAYSDAKGQNFSFDPYDALGRPMKRTEPDLTTSWTWGNLATSYNIGKLASISATGSNGTHTEANTFDSKTRLLTKTVTIPNDAAYTYSYSYSATTGLLDTLQYPLSAGGYQLKLQYNYLNGQLKSIQDFNALPATFWTANTTNVRGQVTQEALGNGVIVNSAFDAVTGWVGSIQAGVGGGTTLQNNSFQFDFDGNVKERKNLNLSLTEDFFYDPDNRLDHSTLNGSINLQMAYDAAGLGNIASRSDVAGGAPWTYYPDKIHAVKLAGNAGNSYAYDLNGNMTTRNGSTAATTWTSFNQPSNIANGTSENLSYFYDGNHQRYEQSYVNSGSTETTYFVGGLLEKVQPSSGDPYYRQYILANGKRVALVSSRRLAGNTNYYLLEDHLASTNSILNPDGTLFVNENYGAYGNGRNPTTWSGSTSSMDQSKIAKVTSIGFTGETTNLAMGLVNLNGRMLDSVTGRMLSPDPQTANPGNTQSWNRYSYVNNNPLSFTDPSGFYVCPGFAPAATCREANAAIAQGFSENKRIQAEFNDWVSFLAADSGKWSIVFAGAGASQDAAASTSYYVREVPLSEYGFAPPDDFYMLASSVSAHSQYPALNDPNYFSAQSQNIQAAGAYGYVGSISDNTLLAQVMFAESAGVQSAYSSIGWSIVNRIGDSEFADTLQGVVYQRNQFASVGGPLWNAASNPGNLTGANLSSYATALGVANGILGGQIPDPTNGATFFYSGSTPSGFFRNAINSGTLVPTSTVGPFTFLTEP